jgi:hypothetical protein
MKTTMSDIYRIMGKINSEGGKVRVEQAGSGGLNLYVDRISPYDGKTIDKGHEYFLRGTKKDIYEALIKIRFIPQYRPYSVRANRRKKTRCWKGYKPVKGKRPYSKGSCRKINRNNKMRSHNSMGQKLYVVITADGTPLSGRIGTLEPPGPIFYTKGEAIKKGRMFRGRVVSVESYYKMRRGLRRNPYTWGPDGYTEKEVLSILSRVAKSPTARAISEIRKIREAIAQDEFENATDAGERLLIKIDRFLSTSLRRNGADHKRHRWQIFGYDVVGNAEDGWDVNDVLPGPVITMSYKAEYDKKTFDSAMARAGVNLRWALIDNGASDEDTIYFNTASGKPLAEMRRVK